MNRAITTTTANAQLHKYHQELQDTERQERKDKCILLALAVAGLIGVYALVMTGVQQNSLTDQTTVEQTEFVNRSSASASIR